jgi:very-short-patch-repair endonuclease/DNA polymerase III delta prime subunit
VTQVNNQDIRARLIQIFRYLQALNQLREPVQREINEQPWTLWFHDLPKHPSVRLGVQPEASSTDDSDDVSTGDDFIFKVSRPTLVEPPSPPKSLLPWLRNGWQQIDGKVTVEPTMRVRNGDQTHTVNFKDDPQRPQQFEEWNIRRDKWVEAETPAYAAYAIFDKLFALQSQIERESEHLELMLGDGIMSWHTKEGLVIHHPMLLLRLQLHFNPEIPEFTITETGQTSELYTAICQSVPEVKASEIARCREDHESGHWHPLQGEDTTRFMRRFINRLSSNGEFVTPNTPLRYPNAPTISRDPVIFLRPRVLGISTALEAILQTLPTSTTFPYSLTSLVGLDGVSNVIPGQTSSIPPSLFRDSPNGEDEHILLSKPANAEQLEIARRLETHGAILVQGPPGTGKTHTIANLIGYLLAQGKSVLVTSEKPKALRVLREKVVEPLQPLCASILSDDSRKQMESTIDAISERLAGADANKLEREAQVLTYQRIEILRQIREMRQKLTEARSGEYRPIVLAGESYTPSQAARYIFNMRETARWIPGPVNPGAPLPLSLQELVELYHSNVFISSRDERELLQLLPEAGKLLSPLEFEQLVDEQAQLSKNNIGYRHDLWASGNHHQPPETIQELHKRFAQEIEPLRDLVGWRLAAIMAGKEGGARRQAWEDLLTEVEHVYEFAAQVQLKILRLNPVIPPDCLPERIEKVLCEVVQYLAKGGKLGGLKLLTKRDWKMVIERVRLNGKPPETQEQFEALRDLIRLQTARLNLVSRWQRQMTILGGPDATALGNQPETTFHQFVDPLRRCLQWYTNIWAPLEMQLKQQGFQWEAFLAEMPVNHSEYGEMLRLRMAVVEALPPIIQAEAARRVYTRNETRLLELARNLSQVGSNATQADIVLMLKDAIRRRDIQAYRTAFNGLNDLHVKREVLQQRRTLLTKLEKVAPGWAAAIRERLESHGGGNVPGNPDEAWLWRQLYDELDRRTKTSLEELEECIVQLNSDLFRVTAELVEKKAWAQQVRHTTLEQRRALQGWRELMRKVGKGTGKRAPRLLEEARSLMPICQTAVPVWIMPLSYVTRNFDMKRNHFDVVIIDEASQADITALIAVYMGSQVVIVGDHEQVSPLAVGQDLDKIQHIIDEHLKGIPNANLYDGKFSIYGLARTTSELVCLHEHFRCVSPIIQFSNELSYDGKIKPLRDDSLVKRRPATIAYRVNSGSKRGKINEEEAYTIASLLIAASQQPEYKDATFGVISMLGSEQAIYIEELLRRYMAPTDYINARVLCGDPAQFQGDERDVMFLSMVDVPAENGGPLPLRTEEGYDDMFKKRFNVAASRARDQMWVIYSLDPEIDLKKDDIRRRLILHARDQQASNAERKKQEEKIESEFERQVFQRLVQAGYHVTTQWPVGAYRIDMVVEADGKRLAIECDGDRWHPQEKLEEDMARQAILERLGWRFVRIRGSQFFRNPNQTMEAVYAKLRSLDIPPVGMATHHTGEVDGKVLKERVIRAAYELRVQWKEQEQQSATPLAAFKLFSRSVASNARINATPPERSAISAQTQASRTDTVTSSTRDGQSKEARTPQQLTPSNRATSPGTSNPASWQTNEGSFNPILYLQTKGIKVIDNRSEKGGIWAVGGEELSSLMKTLADKGFHFRYIPGGVPYDNGATTRYRDGWYLRNYPVEEKTR